MSCPSARGGRLRTGAAGRHRLRSRSAYSAPCAVARPPAYALRRTRCEGRSRQRSRASRRRSVDKSGSRDPPASCACGQSGPRDGLRDEAYLAYRSTLLGRRVGLVDIFAPEALDLQVSYVSSRAVAPEWSRLRAAGGLQQLFPSWPRTSSLSPPREAAARSAQVADLCAVHRRVAVLFCRALHAGGCWRGDGGDARPVRVPN